MRERYAALQAAEPERIVSVDASLPLEDVTLAVVTILRSKVEEWNA